MNNTRVLFAVFTKPKENIVNLYRCLHVFQNLNQRSLPDGYSENQNIDTSLFFTNLPNKKRSRKPKLPKLPIHAGSLIIKCKNEELNHYSGMHYNKFQTIPLASKNWYSRKSKGDYFTILPAGEHSAFLTKEDLKITFEENGVRSKIIQQLKKINVTHPTVIQAKVLNPLLQGDNVFISAECGSGKTLGYVIATIENILKWKEYENKELKKRNHNSPLGIILLPTRELAIQVGLLVQKLSVDLGVQSHTLIGGNINDLLEKPEMIPVDILTCTLSVLQRHLKRELYWTNFCKHMIIDETDTFIEKSFIKNVKALLYNTKLKFTGFRSPFTEQRSAQICFVSATSPSEMEPLISELIQGNNMVNVSTPYLHRPVINAQQVFMRVGKKDKPYDLLSIVKNNSKKKIPTMIFSNRLKTATWLSLFLNENGIDCGNLSHRSSASDRLMHYRDFEAGYINVISCTDLASRGLDFTQVKHVINFEFPTFMIDYIHRCGRTGRISQGENCLITNFISGKHEVPLLHKIEMAVRTRSTLPSINQNRILKKYNK